MSGICGIHSPGDPALADGTILHRMLEAIGHRGKAGRSSFVDDTTGVAIGHVFAPAFQRPDEAEVLNWHEDEEYVATLDGAIFNDADFRAADRPWRYIDRDTGTVVEHLRQQPTEFPAKLDGHFSLAVWDKKQRCLQLARDIFGIKPLYYAHIPEKRLVVFASALKGILVHPAVNRRLNRDALTTYLTFGYVPAPLSMFDGIYKVFPGEVLKIDARGSLTLRQYSHLPRYEPQEGELEAFAAQLRERVLHAVAKHIEGTQRVGVLWSGGVDSTVMLGALKILGVPERQTFTVGFRDDPTDRAHLSADLYWTERTAQGLTTTHHPVIIDQDHNPYLLLPRLLRQFEEPLQTPSPYLKFLLAETVYQHGLNSCVNGQGGESLTLRTTPKKLKKAYTIAGKDASVEELFLARRMKFFSFDEQVQLLIDPREDPRAVVLHLLNRYRQGVEADNVNDALSGMSMRVLRHKGMTAQERTSVLSGVEVRSPFVDASLIEFANHIPARFKGAESDDMAKALFKCAFKDVLPEELANRKKVGHPSYSWSRGEIDALKHRLLSPAGLERTGLLRPEAVQSVLDLDIPSTRKWAGKRTWGLLVLQAWFELYVNGNEDFFPDPKELSA